MALDPSRTKERNAIVNTFLDKDKNREISGEEFVRVFTKAGELQKVLGEKGLAYTGDLDPTKIADMLPQVCNNEKMRAIFEKGISEYLKNESKIANSEAGLAGVVDSIEMPSGGSICDAFRNKSGSPSR